MAETVKNLGNLGSIPGLGRPLGGRHGNPIWYFLPVEPPKDRSAWQAKNHTQLSD